MELELLDERDRWLVDANQITHYARRKNKTEFSPECINIPTREDDPTVTFSKGLEPPLVEDGEFCKDCEQEYYLLVMLDILTGRGEEGSDPDEISLANAAPWVKKTVSLMVSEYQEEPEYVNLFKEVELEQMYDMIISVGVVIGFFAEVNNIYPLVVEEKKKGNSPTSVDASSREL